MCEEKYLEVSEDRAESLVQKAETIISSVSAALLRERRMSQPKVAV